MTLIHCTRCHGEGEIPCPDPTGASVATCPACHGVGRRNVAEKPEPTTGVLIAHEGGASVYMVPSASTAGAFYRVRFYGNDPTPENQYPIVCTCPAGKSRPDISCRHMRAAAQFCKDEDARNRRPVAPVNVSALCD